MPPIRVLHVTSVLNYGGIENLIMNIFRNIKREEIVFDFLVIREDVGIFEDEISKLGGRIYKIPSMKKSGYFSFQKNLMNFFKSHPEYSIIHSHVNTFNGPVLECAKKCGIKTRISHAHTAYPKYTFIEKAVKYFFKSMIKNSATDFFSCSKLASDWLYGKNFADNKVLINGIDSNNFAFSLQKRKTLRKQLNIENKFVLINVARFSKEKNHLFLLNILNELKKKQIDFSLICIGKGKQKKHFLKCANRLNLMEKIHILDSLSNVNDFYNAADVYVAPSLFEGFGLSVAEAQFNSLPCIVSDSFPNEIKLSNNCKFLSLKDKASVWVDSILSAERKDLSKYNLPQLRMYDISYTVEYLSEFYLDKI